MKKEEIENKIQIASESIEQCIKLSNTGESLTVEKLANEVMLSMKSLLERDDIGDEKDKESAKRRIIILLIQAYNRLANSALDQGHCASGVEMAERGLELGKKYNIRDPEFGMYIVLGNSQRGLSDYAAAMQSYETALQIAESSANKSRSGMALGSIGSVYLFLCDYHQALDHYSRALDIHKELDFKAGMAAWNSNIGNVYTYLQDYAAAELYYQRAMELYESEGNRAGVALCLGNLGIVYKEQGEYQKSVDISKKAMAAYTELGMKTNLTVECCNLGETQRLMGNYRQAEDLFLQGLKLAQSISEKSHIADLQNFLGAIYSNELSSETNLKAAEVYLLESIALNEELEIKKPIHYFNLSQLYKKQKRWEECQHYYEQFHLMEKEVQSEEAKKQSRLLEYRRKIEDSERDRQLKLARFQEQEKILHNILPQKIADRILEGEKQIADACEEISVFFCDLVGFTTLSQSISAHELVDLLNEIFSDFDRMAVQHGLEKIKTIGDAYMAAAGVPLAQQDHAQRAAAFALDVMEYMQKFRQNRSLKLNLRAGLHCGHAVAGIIGENKFSYDIWGDAVNTASRMESHGLENRIHISEDFKNKLGDGYRTESRGELEIKGKGKMKTFFLLPNGSHA